MKKKLSADDYKSILVIVIGFLVLFQIFNWKATYYIAIAVGILSLISGLTASWILWIWEKIALVLGWINTRIILGVVFFIFLTPIAMITRILTKNILQLRKSGNSYYITRNHKFKPEDLDKTW